MTLEDELGRQRRAAAQKRSDREQRVRDQAIEHVRHSAQIDKAIAVGDAVPPIVLPDARGEVLDVAGLLARGPVVVSFYRGGWCPYCNLELRALQQELDALHRLGASLVAISPERPDSSLSTQERNDLSFPVLSDHDDQVARAFGIVHTIDPTVVGYQRGNGVDVAAVNGADVAEVPVPATYVVDRAGVVRFAVVDPDYTRRADPQQVLTVLRRLARDDAQPGEVGEV